MPFLQQLIGNTNWTVWSTIQGAIAQVISKSNSLDETAVASFVLKENVIVEMTLNGGINQALSVISTIKFFCVTILFY